MQSSQGAAERATMLVVDDTPDNIALMGAILKDQYKVKVANNGEKALLIARGEVPPDLILLDIMMPGMDGYEVCRRLKADPGTSHIPVIFLTARTDVEDERLGLDLGAVDYITKPISPPILLARVRNHLSLKAASDFLRDQNSFLEREVDRRTHEVRAIQEVTILALASLAETRDNDTGNHLKRTQRYIKSLTDRLRSQERHRPTLTDEYVAMVFKSAPLHDIGKVGIPDRILLKTGKLDPEEFEIMKGHAALGRGAIENAERDLGSRVEFLRIAKEIAYSHHEKWDGSGYPEALAGEAIPFAARLMAIADVYDALISRRVYKPGMPHDLACEVVLEGRGSHFDPLLVDAFAECKDEFKEIARAHGEGA